MNRFVFKRHHISHMSFINNFNEKILLNFFGKIVIINPFFKFHVFSREKDSFCFVFSKGGAESNIVNAYNTQVCNMELYFLYSNHKLYFINIIVNSDRSPRHL